MEKKILIFDSHQNLSTENLNLLNKDFKILVLKTMNEVDYNQEGVTIFINDGNSSDILSRLKKKPDIIISSYPTTLQNFDKSIVFPFLNEISFSELNKVIVTIYEKRFANQKYQILLKKFRQTIEKIKSKFLTITKTISFLKNENRLLQKNMQNITLQKIEFETKHKEFYQELSLAGELQKNLLPTEFPFQDKVNIVSKYLPCAIIGGDFYDVTKIDDNHFAVSIIDISGHGIRSALIASMSKALFQKHIFSSLSTSEIIGKINNEFCKMVRSEEDFLTSFLMIINVHDMTATFTNAAHPYPLHLKSDGTIDELEKGGFFIGMFSDAEYEEGSVILTKGDRLLLYTDGVVEVKNEDHEDFGRERLKDLLQNSINDSLENVSNDLLNQMLFYSTDTIFDDDITILIMEMN